ncbi:HEL123Wp [Eremothecium sinecaudum]|uniref:HEL123Wp n=1 Tax=Eremothecium sinecaudum TaxID=45286 RepID=A0A0X8HTC9_9SACH|nr:HEL123Wp [Eremothecium sinecaudum]AMD21157.1 HEL123Wp [Eremothecium sinecaudum]
MRAPPQPRRSRHRYVSQVLQVVQDAVTLQKARERWHIHRLHKVNRANCRNGKPGTTSRRENSDLSIRLTDIANQPSGVDLQKKRRMPLLIASFPRGCGRSPRFNALEKNKWCKAMITRRKYKLKSFNSGAVPITGKGKKPTGDYSIKKEIAKHAHMKVNYHRKGVMNSTCVLVDIKNNQPPEYLTFDRDYSLRLCDYPSLSIRKPETLSIRKSEAKAC